MTANPFAALLRDVPRAEYLRKRLRYEPDTGHLFWLDCEEMPAIWRNKYAGTRALSAVNMRGYCTGHIDKVRYSAHRVIWALHYGEWPDGEIDHINGIPTDNRISNLRIVTRQENEKNKFMRSDNKSGVTGVNWDSGKSKWRAQIRAEGKNIHLGYFSSLEDATASRAKANERYGFSPRHGEARPEAGSAA